MRYEFLGPGLEDWWVVVEDEFHKVIRLNTGEYTVILEEREAVGQKVEARPATHIEKMLAEVVWEKYQESLDW